MSIYHTANRADPFAAPVHAAVEAASAARVMAFSAVRTIHATLVDRWTQRRLARFSDHLLRDLGFERDWDGTVRSLRDAD